MDGMCASRRANVHMPPSHPHAASASATSPLFLGGRGKSAALASATVSISARGHQQNRVRLRPAIFQHSHTNNPSPHHPQRMSQQFLPSVKGLSQRTADEKARAQAKDKGTHEHLRGLLRLPENRECADCTARLTGWAALPHGIFLCINCAQIHRHIGRHISQVKAINTGTYLWYDDEVACMEIMGNKRANELYLAAPGAPQKPAAEAPAHIKEAYVRNKYEKQAWVRKAAAPPAPTKTPSSSAPAVAAATSALRSEPTLVDLWAKSDSASTATATTATAPARRPAFSLAKQAAKPVPDLMDAEIPQGATSSCRQTLAFNPFASTAPSAPSPSGDFFAAFGM